MENFELYKSVSLFMIWPPSGIAHRYPKGYWLW